MRFHLWEEEVVVVVLQSSHLIDWVIRIWELVVLSKEIWIHRLYRDALTWDHSRLHTIRRL